MRTTDVIAAEQRAADAASASTTLTASDVEVLRMLDFSGLDSASDQLGTDFKKDRETAGFGFWLDEVNGKRLAAALKERDDTGATKDFSEFLRIAEEIGFGTVSRIAFCDGESQESCWFLWHREHAVLLTASTYRTIQLNSANIHFNHLPHSGGHLSWYRSGQYERVGERMAFCGELDAAQALRLKMKGLLATGTFVKKWAGLAGVGGYHWGERELHLHSLHNDSYKVAAAKNRALLKDRLFGEQATAGSPNLRTEMFQSIGHLFDGAK